MCLAGLFQTGQQVFIEDQRRHALIFELRQHVAEGRLRHLRQTRNLVVFQPDLDGLVARLDGGPLHHRHKPGERAHSNHYKQQPPYGLQTLVHKNSSKSLFM